MYAIKKLMALGAVNIRKHLPAPRRGNYAVKFTESKAMLHSQLCLAPKNFSLYEEMFTSVRDCNDW